MVPREHAHICKEPVNTTFYRYLGDCNNCTQKAICRIYIKIHIVKILSLFKER